MLLRTALLSAGVVFAGEVVVYSGDGCVFGQSKLAASSTSGCFPADSIYAAEIGRNVYPPCVFSLYSDSNCQSLVHTLNSGKGYTGNCLSGPPDQGSTKLGYKSVSITCNPSEPYPDKPAGSSSAADFSVDMAVAGARPLTAGEGNFTAALQKRSDRPVPDMRNGVGYYNPQLLIAGIAVGGRNIIVQGVTYATGGFGPPAGAIYEDARAFIHQFWTECLTSRSSSFADTIVGESGVQYFLDMEGLGGFIPYNYVQAIGPAAFVTQIIDALEGMVNNGADQVVWTGFVDGVRYIQATLSVFN